MNGEIKRRDTFKDRQLSDKPKHSKKKEVVLTRNFLCLPYSFLFRKLRFMSIFENQNFAKLRF